MQEEFTAPIKKIAFARIGVGREFELIGGSDEISVFLFDLGEEVV